MGSASGLLVLAAIGYFWLNLVTYSRYYISNLSGYHVLFLSLLCGSAHFVAAHLVLYMIRADNLGYSLDSYFDSLTSELSAGGKPETILVSVAIAGSIAFLIFLLLRRWHSGIISWMTNRKGYLIEGVLSESLGNTPIKIYSRNDRVYVGYAVSMPAIPMGGGRLPEVNLIMISSGFVNREDGSEKIVDDYESFLGARVREIARRKLAILERKIYLNGQEIKSKSALRSLLDGNQLTQENLEILSALIEPPLIIIPLEEIVLVTSVPTEAAEAEENKSFR